MLSKVMTELPLLATKEGGTTTRHSCELVVSKNQLNITQSVFRNFDNLGIELLIMKIISRFINN